MSHIHIDVEDVSFGYERGTDHTILKHLSLHASETDSIGLVGANGVGKSTFLKLLVGLNLNFTGSIRIVEDVAFAPRNYGLPEAEVRRRVDQALELTGISHLKDKQIYKMSGGEKKLASIATIPSMTPDIILMDEPSIALNPKNRRNLIHILNSFEHLKIIASHDLDMILDTCKRTILMADGRIICDGPTEEILTDRELLEDYELELPLRLQ